MNRLVAAAITALSLALTAPAPLAAQDCSTPAESARAPRRGVIELDPVEIVGRVPRAFVVLAPPSAHDYELPELRRRLAPEVVRTVRGAPF